MDCPRLLDSSLGEVARLHPISLSIHQCLAPLSWAEMKLPPADPEVNVRQLIEIFGPDDTLGVYRVTAVDTDYATGVRTLSLDHGFATLSDDIAPGGEEVFFTGSVRGVLEHLLTHQTGQPRWSLGNCDAPEDYQIVYQYGYENLMTAILSVSGSLPEGYAWRFEMSGAWVMHLEKLSSEEICEARLTRDLRSAQVNIDTADLCTRVFPFGAVVEDVRVDLTSRLGAAYVDADTTGTWGVVARSFTEPKIDNAPLLEQIARQYLEKRKDPVVSVRLSALALSEATGEPLDRFRPGALCRLPLPEAGIALAERVVEVEYPDLISRPREAILTLANRRKSAEDELTALMRENTFQILAGSGGYMTTTMAYSGAGCTNSPSEESLYITEEFVVIDSVVLTITLPYRIPTVWVRVDGTLLPGSIQSSSGITRSLDITPYLTRDAGNAIAIGKHSFSIAPARDSDVSYEATVRIVALMKSSAV